MKTIARRTGVGASHRWGWHVGHTIDRKRDRPEYTARARYAERVVVRKGVDRVGNRPIVSVLFCYCYGTHGVCVRRTRTLLRSKMGGATCSSICIIIVIAIINNISQVSDRLKGGRGVRVKIRRVVRHGNVARGRSRKTGVCVRDGKIPAIVSPTP